MLDFTKYPDYFRYRSLKLTSPMMLGFDVYALQTALAAVGFDPSGFDGYFGNNTNKAVRDFQSSAGLVVDGIAGGATQQKAASLLVTKYTKAYGLPKGLMFGQTEHESSFRLGNYSVMYEDGSYDVGVVQRNTRFATPKDGFTVPDSLSVLGLNTKDYFNKYSGVADTFRRWGLAAGSWNVPAFTNYLAGRVQPYAVPNQTQLDAIENYIASVTAYMVL